MEFQVPMASIIVTNKPRCTYVGFAKKSGMKQGFLVITPKCGNPDNILSLFATKFITYDSRGNPVYFFTSYYCPSKNYDYEDDYEEDYDEVCKNVEECIPPDWHYGDIDDYDDTEEDYDDYEEEEI